VEAIFKPIFIVVVIASGCKGLTMSKFRSCPLTALIAVVAFAINQSPSTAADIDHGEQLARRWCSTCHLVANDQRQASADVPSFSAIARTPNFSPGKVAYFLLDPHPKMPNLSLGRREADDIAAYIASLRK
jgi:mono/diheme cytochrome c family protein